GGERNVEQRIVDAAQKRESEHDLPRGKEASGRVGAGGNPRPLELAGVLVREAVRAAQQDADVRPEQRALLPVLIDAERPLLREQDRGDAAALLHGERLVLLRVGKVEQLELDSRLSAVREDGGGDKLLEAA